MRKWMFLFFLLFLFYPLKPEESVTNVFAINKNEESQIWCLDVSKASLTSRDLHLFDQVKIVTVYPKNYIIGIDESAKRKLYHFSYHSIESLEKVYSQKLQHLGFFDEKEKMERVGISLNKIKVFGKKQQIDSLNILNLVLSDEKKCNSMIEYD